MRYYLIDLENVPKCFDKVGIDTFSKSDRVIVFYREVLHSKLIKSIKSVLDVYCRNVSYIKVSSHTKNAMDFSLVACLGTIIGNFKGSRLEIVIVSRDSGYHGILDYIDFIKGRLRYELSFSFVSELIGSRGYIRLLDAAISSTYSKLANEEIKRYCCKNERNLDFNVVLNILRCCTTTCCVHNNLTKYFGNVGLDLYNWMKSNYIVIGRKG